MQVHVHVCVRAHMCECIHTCMWRQRGAEIVTTAVSSLEVIWSMAGLSPDLAPEPWRYPAELLVFSQG